MLPDSPRPIEQTERLRTKRSPDVYIVIDPAQDYEESKVILGVYGSLTAAVFATPMLRRLHVAAFDLPYRLTHIERWQGGAHIETHEYDPRRDTPTNHGWQAVLR